MDMLRQLAINPLPSTVLVSIKMSLGMFEDQILLPKPQETLIKTSHLVGI